MKSLEKAINTLNRVAKPSTASSLDPRMRLAVVLLYIVTVISVPMMEPDRLIWMFVFPILTSEIQGIGYGRVFIRSLWIVPLIALIGIFNPILDRQPGWIIGSVVISRGWITTFTLILRGLLALQALLVLILSMGFYDICRALNGLGVPRVLTTQLMMLYRYMGVLLQEALTMHRAREARGFGRRNYPLRMWGTFVGQLLLRSVHRSRRINDAMEARGFNGAYYWSGHNGAPSLASWAWLIVWAGVFAALRFVDFTEIFNNIITHSI